MSNTNPLDSVVFMSLPQSFKLPADAFIIDTSIPLPVQKTAAEVQLDPTLLTQEQIFAGILTVLAYDTANIHTNYYRTLIKAAKPNIVQELTQAAVLKAKNDDYEIADEIFAALRALEPENPAVILNSALFFDQRADSYRRSGLTEDADAWDESAGKYYKEVMQAEPAVPDAFFNAGFFYLKQHNFPKAKSCFESYLRLTENDESSQNENTAYKRERAQAIVFDINNRNLDDELFKSAFDFICAGQEEEGLKCIHRFLEKNPKVWNAWFMLGWALRRLNRWQDAKSAFEQSLSCAGENSDIHNELSLCLMELGDYEKAEKHLRKALKLEPENTKIMSNMGFLALKQANPSEAARYFTAVLEFDPNDCISRNALSKLEL